eukprot:2280338-Ditylum_brightwellii.AAC.1
MKGRHTSQDGKVVGSYHKNPVLNSIIYDIEFPGGSVKEYGANVIAQNIYSTLDKKGYSKVVLDAILEHSKDDWAISKSDKYIITKKGTKQLRKSTIGWKMLVRLEGWD